VGHSETHRKRRARPVGVESSWPAWKCGRERRSAWAHANESFATRARANRHENDDARAAAGVELAKSVAPRPALLALPDTPAIFHSPPAIALEPLYALRRLCDRTD
jgi:hypothetical protein